MDIDGYLADPAMQGDTGRHSQESGCSYIDHIKWLLS